MCLMRPLFLWFPQIDNFTICSDFDFISHESLSLFSTLTLYLLTLILTLIKPEKGVLLASTIQRSKPELERLVKYRDF